VEEINSQQEFDNTCGKEKKCVLFVLEDLLDTTAAKRNKSLEVIQALAKKNRHMTFVWLAANSQSNLESSLQLTFGFPAVVMLREGPSGEKVFFIHRGKFTSEDLNSFVTAPRGLSMGTQLQA